MVIERAKKSDCLTCSGCSIDISFRSLMSTITSIPWWLRGMTGAWSALPASSSTQMGLCCDQSRSILRFRDGGSGIS